MFLFHPCCSGLSVIIIVCGNWNTLCLPFDVEDFEGTLFADATVKTLNDATFQDGTLTLEFSGNLTSMEAGRPYIVKWDGDGSNNLVNPTFSGVYINAHPDNLIHYYGPVTFVGTYAPVQIPSTGDDTKLFLGANSTLYWPNGAMTIGCQRAYFQLNGITAGDPVNDVRAFVLNFGDGEEASGITTTNFTNDTNSSDAWFDMSGRQLNGIPSRAGISLN